MRANKDADIVGYLRCFVVEKQIAATIYATWGSGVCILAPRGASQIALLGEGPSLGFQ